MDREVWILPLFAQGLATEHASTSDSIATQHTRESCRHYLYPVQPWFMVNGNVEGFYAWETYDRTEITLSTL